MTRLSAFLSMQEWPINLYMLQNNTSARKVPRQLRTKYSIELRAFFKIMDI